MRGHRGLFFRPFCLGMHPSTAGVRTRLELILVCPDSQLAHRGATAASSFDPQGLMSIRKAALQSG